MAEAAATAASPTTGIVAAAQDEVSVAIASLFGNFGQEFQALSAQAQSFHAQFVSLMNAGAGAYGSAEAANAAQTILGGLDGGVLGGVGQSLGGVVSGGQAALGQLAGNLGVGVNGAVTALGNGSIGAFVGGELQSGAQAISNAIAGAQLTVGGLQTGGAAGVLDGLSSFGATVAGPYQALFTNTVNNLGSIGNTLVSNPFPFLHQLVNNQIFYGQTIATQLATGIQNLPTELANLPAAIQAGIQQIANFNPGAFVQQLINTQIGYAQTIATGLQSAAQDLVTGIQTLPAGLATAFQALLAGDPSSAFSALSSALETAFLPGFSLATLPSGIMSVTPLGPLGDLAPIFNIPGQIAQSFADLLPLGTVPHMMAQNATNLVEAFTNFGTTLDLNALNINFGLPLQLILDGIGGPINGLSAFNSTAVALGSALQTGDLTGALTAFLDAPANVTNAFLNGTTNLLLPSADLGGGLSSAVEIPFGGILTPLTLPTLVINILGTDTPLPLLGGTGVGGIIPGLIGFGPQLAAAIMSTM
ncbi:hypothetical protein AWC23_03555 [Mycobacterium saskatchewanense]|uniref:PE domain-containing protein n=1 Tax=Mycobacterium saskatchewanense TaxID=220927 RepID=A0AAJ3NUB8_9MYCO|nr:hypothetical protein AWC23_03555 [Mycobacterium saskatchewanense]